MTVIGVCGFIDSGKGTVGSILEKAGFEKESFAKPLKDAVALIFGWPRHLLEGDTPESREWREKRDEWWSEKLDRDFSPRLAMQLMGTEAVREGIHDDVWIRSLQKRLDNQKNYVVTDVRFPNEVNAIREIGGKILRVKRGPEPEWWNDALWDNGFGQKPKIAPFGGWMAEWGVHISEWAWIGQEIDHTITNDGTLEELENNVREFIKELKATENTCT